MTLMRKIEWLDKVSTHNKDGIMNFIKNPNQNESKI